MWVEECIAGTKKALASVLCGRDRVRVPEQVTEVPSSKSTGAYNKWEHNSPTLPQGCGSLKEPDVGFIVLTASLQSTIKSAMSHNNSRISLSVVLFTALLARTSATSPSNIVDEDQGIAAAWRGEAENSVGQSAAVGLTETGSSAPKGEKADWQPEDDEGELPITGWSDALSGHRLDSKTSCVHIRDEISVAEERFKVNTKRSLEVNAAPTTLNDDVLMLGGLCRSCMALER